MISTVLAVLRDPGVLECASQEGGSTLLETSFGVDRIEALAAGIPDPVYDRWIRAGDLVMPAFLASWACMFTILPVYAVVQFGGSATSALPRSQTISFAAMVAVLGDGVRHVVTVLPDPGILAAVSASLGISAGLVALGLAVTYLLLWALFLGALVFSVPHEFGHVVAMVKNGGRVEGYGLVLAGLVPVGVYVRSDTGGHGRGGDGTGIQRQIAAAGVVNDTILAAVLGAVALACYLTVSVVLGRVLLVLAGAWIVSAAANSFPIWGLDGGQYLSWFYRDSAVCRRARIVDPDRLDF